MDKLGHTKHTYPFSVPNPDPLIVRVVSPGLTVMGDILVMLAASTIFGVNNKSIPTLKMVISLILAIKLASFIRIY